MIYNTDWFINKSKSIHDDKYDYSLVDYKNSKTKVNIICKLHGVFEQIPNKHINIKRGCPTCGGTKKLTTNEFIEKSINIYGDKYDYSLVDYVNSHIKVKIICSTHGVFEQMPYSHLNGNGCPVCGYNRNSFVENCKNIYGDKYDYRLTEYKNAYTKVKINCNKHGDFEQFPNSHIESGCVLCSREESFIDNSISIHNNKYDYSNVKYKDKYTKVKIICPIHGEFKQKPVYHIRGNGCKKCSDDDKKLKTEFFIEKANKIHDDKYDYSLVDYVSTFDKVKIICKNHGTFKQRPNDHINGKKRGCPYCNESYGEREIEKILKENNIQFERQKKFKGCKNILLLSFDFYLPKYEYCIEFDGVQHFLPIRYFGGSKKLKYTKINDEIKNKYCFENNIKLIRIKYNESVSDKLIKELCISQ
jgi:hypothetical protein